MAGLGHIAVGLAAGRFLSSRQGVRLGFAGAALGLTALSMAPDLDVVGFALGIPYEAPLGHRGASHAVATALLLAGVLASLPRRAGASRPMLFTLVLGVVVSHGLLDTLTDGGHGIALLWPLDNTRYFAPWRPIPVSPIGRGLLSARGATVMLAELVGFAPLWVWALWPRGGPRSRLNNE
ncbi:MAG: metal-dependent hydrolase [Nannocystales bacterium]